MVVASPPAPPSIRLRPSVRWHYAARTVSGSGAGSGPRGLSAYSPPASVRVSGRTNVVRGLGVLLLMPDRYESQNPEPNQRKRRGFGNLRRLRTRNCKLITASACTFPAAITRERELQLRTSRNRYCRR